MNDTDSLVKELEQDIAAATAKSHEQKTVLLAADHAGFELKEKIKAHLRERGWSLEDLGAFDFDSLDDYPDYMHMVGKRVSAEPEHYMAIIIGGSGQGEAIVVNRYNHVYAAVYYGGNFDMVKTTRQHNNANILSLGARFIGPEEALKAVDLFLDTPYMSDERHVRRLAKIDSVSHDKYSF